VLTECDKLATISRMDIDIHNRADNWPTNPKRGRNYKRGKHNPDVVVWRLFWWRKVAKEVGQVISRAEAARILGVSHDTVMRRINAGTYTGVKFDDDAAWNWYVSLTDVIRDAEDSVLESGTFAEINSHK